MWITFTVSDMLITMLFNPISSILKSLRLQFLVIWSKGKDPVNKFWTWLIIYRCILVNLQIEDGTPQVPSHLIFLYGLNIQIQNHSCLHWGRDTPASPKKQGICHDLSDLTDSLLMIVSSSFNLSGANISRWFA